MNSIQLKQFVTADSITHSKFGDVLPADILLQVYPNADKFYIVNTKPSLHPGEHWTVVYMQGNNNNLIEFWDSLGQDPVTYNNYFKHFFRDKEYIYSNRILQGEAQTCGYFCLYYAYHRSRAYTMNDIVNSFTNDKACNDILVRDFVHRCL